MILLPPRPGLTLSVQIMVAEAIVWTAAAAGAAWAVHGFLSARRATPPGATG
ncbi:MULTISPECIES: hypothetical protein [unclassified Streptomyces]|uniref:hypothetical protein n=1 Tax=unclassified Streptomyces TaxID=2593676 RepID=UPI0033B8E522